ncbi:MAG: hypothetical protein E7478_04440 [Ruminococcaceae bacterium]|nr:hypothetical protein [Oscillospiraceae bacterium]
MAGLLPDFSNEINEDRSDALLRFSYDNTLEEIDGAMATFQQRYTGKKHKIMLVAYIILTIAAIVLIIFDHTNILPYLALVFCIFNLYYTLTDRKRMRKKIINAIKDTNPEDYTATVYDDKIEIETVIMPKEGEIQMESNDEETQNIAPIKSVFVYGADMLDFDENEDSLLLIVARRQTYCFPKRCMTKEQEEQLRCILKEKTEM